MIATILPLALAMAGGSAYPADVTPGMSVRVEWTAEAADAGPARLTPTEIVTGIVATVDRSTLTVRSERRGQLVAVPWARVHRIERQTRVHEGGHPLSWAGRGFLIGALAGGAIGLAAGGCSPDEWCVVPRQETMVIGAGAFGLLGAVLGAVGGLAGHDHPGWQPLSIGPAQVSVVPQLAPHAAGARVIVRMSGAVRHRP